MTRYDIVVDYEQFKNLHAVAIGKKWGVFDSKTKKELLPTIYDDVDILDQNCFAVRVGNVWGALRSEHEALSEIRYDAIYNFDDEFIVLESNGKKRLLSKATTSTTREYERILPSINNYCTVTSNFAYGVICKNPLTEVLHPHCDFLFHISGTKYFAKIYTKWYLIDLKENTELLLEYDDIRPVDQKNYFIVRKVDLKGVIDKDLKVVIPLKYNFISSMGQGLFYASIGINFNRLVGVVHATKGTIIDCKYKNVTRLDNNLFSISDDSGKCALFDNNNRLTEFKYDSILCMNHSLYVYVSYKQTENTASDEDDKQLVGLIDSSGKELIPPIYDDIDVTDCGFIVCKDGKSGVCDRNYNLVSKIIYDDIINIFDGRATVILDGYKGSFYF